MRECRRYRIPKLLVLLLVCACVPWATAQANDQAVEARHVEGDLVIRLSEGVTPLDVAAIARALAEVPGASSRHSFKKLPPKGQLPQQLEARLAEGSPGAAERVDQALDALRDVYVLSLGSDEEADRLIAELAEESAVVYAEPNWILETDHVPDDPFFHSSGSWGQPYADLWGLHKISVEQAWDLATGADVVVGVSDTGVDITHPEISQRIWALPGEDLNGNGVVDGSPIDCSLEPPPPPDGDFNCLDDDGNGYVDDVRGWDFFENDNDPEDEHGHGTHVSGTIAAEGNNGIGVIGVAYDARIMPIRCFGPSGSTTTEMAAQSVTYAALTGVDVLNMSWGGTGGGAVLGDAIRTAYEAGVLLVAAAGNSSMDVEDYYPANYPGVMAIAALTHTDEDSEFSNFGAGISVSAPGGDNEDPDDEERMFNNILSLKSADAQAMNIPSQIVDEIYYRARGTSMASPHAAGAGALVLSYHPGLSTDLVEVLLQASADDIGEPGFDPLTGHGRINARAALELSDLALSRAELIAGLRLDDQIAAGDGPFTAIIEVKNVGVVGARDIRLELWDGKPGTGNRPLDSWTVKELAPGGSYGEKRIYALGDPGAHELVLVVDPYNSIREIATFNNSASSDLHVMKYQWIESTVSAILDNFQQTPAISGNFITWVDRRDGHSELYLYDIRDGSEKRLTEVESSKTHPAISGMNIVWLDRRDGRYDLYSIDLDSGEESVVTTVDASRSAPAIDGEIVTWADRRFGNYDIFVSSPDGGGDTVVFDELSSDYTPRISGKMLTWSSSLEGIYSLHRYDLSTGTDEVFLSSEDGLFSPDISPAGIAYGRGVFSGPKDMDFDVYLRRTGQPESERLSEGPGFKFSISMSSGTVTWLEGLVNNDLIASEAATGARPRIVSGVVRGRPEVDNGRIVWAECRHPMMTYCPTDIYMAQRDTFPGSPRNFTARSASSTSIALDWSDGAEKDLWVYRVYRRTSLSAPFQLIASSANSNYTDRHLKTGKRYYYRVTAVDLNNGEGGFSEEKSAVPRKPCPDCPEIEDTPNGDNR